MFLLHVVILNQGSSSSSFSLLSFSWEIFIYPGMW